MCFSSVRRRLDNKHAVPVFQVNRGFDVGDQLWTFSQAWCPARCQFPEAFGPFRAVAGLSWIEHPASRIAKWIPQVCLSRSVSCTRWCGFPVESHKGSSVFQAHTLGCQGVCVLFVITQLCLSFRSVTPTHGSRLKCAPRHARVQAGLFSKVCAKISCTLQGSLCCTLWTVRSCAYTSISGSCLPSRSC